MASVANGLPFNWSVCISLIPVSAKSVTVSVCFGEPPEILSAQHKLYFCKSGESLGTSILIVVVGAIDTVTQIQTRLMSSQYEQLIKKTKFGK